MSKKRYDWFGIFDWLADQIAFSGNTNLQSKFPETKLADEIESPDNQVREWAREADAMEKGKASDGHRPPLHQKI